MRHLAMFLSGALIVGPAPALEVTGEGDFKLSAEEWAHCQRVGCAVIPQDMLQQGLERVMRQSYEAGLQACNKRT